MSSLEEIRNDRIKKRELLRAAGMDPYTGHVSRTHKIDAVIRDFEELSAEETTVAIAGRVISIRRHGGSAFADIDDST